jgi:hypothetical protein
MVNSHLVYLVKKINLSGEKFLKGTVQRDQ